MTTLIDWKLTEQELQTLEDAISRLEFSGPYKEERKQELLRLLQGIKEPVFPLQNVQRLIFKLEEVKLPYHARNVLKAMKNEYSGAQDKK